MRNLVVILIIISCLVGVIIQTKHPVVSSLSDSPRNISKTPVTKSDAIQRAYRYYNEAKMLFAQGDYAGAIASWEIVLDELEHIAGAEGIRAEANFNIAMALLKRLRYVDAIPRLREATKLYTAVTGTEDARAECYYFIGLSLTELGQDKESLVEFQRALPLYNTDMKSLLKKAGCHQELGLALGRLMQAEEAVREFRACLVIIGGRPEYKEAEASLHYRIGDNLFRTAQYGDALKELEASLALYRHLGNDRSSEAICHNKIGMVLNRLGRHEEALTQFEAALALYSHLPADHQDILGLRLNLGSQLMTIGRYRKAVEQFDMILADLAATGNKREHDIRATALMNRGQADQEMGHFEEAIGDLQAAISAYQGLPNGDLGCAACLTNMAGTLHALGQHEPALEAYSKALRLFGRNYDSTTNIEMQSHLASGHLNIAGILTDSGHYEEAIQHLRYALGVYSDIPNEVGQATTYLVMSDVFCEMKHYDSALKECQSATEFIDRRPEDRQLRYGYQLYKARVLVGQKQFREALDVMKDINWTSNVDGDLLLASAYEGLGDNQSLSTSLKYRLEAIQSLEQRRQSILSAEYRTSWFEHSAGDFQKLVSLILRMENRSIPITDFKIVEWGTEAEQIAFHFADRGKGRSLTDKLLEKAINKHTKPDIELLAKNKDISLQISKLTSLREELPVTETERRKELTSKIDELLQQRNMLEVEIKRTALGGYVAPEFRKPMDMARELPQGTAVLQYSVGEKESWLLILTRDGVTAHKLGAETQALPELLPRQEATLGQLTQAWKERPEKIGLDGLVSLARMRAEDLSRRDQERHNLINAEQERRILERLGEVALPDSAFSELRDKGIRHLLVIPDGSLHYVPFAMLRVPKDSKASQQYFVEEFAISYTPAMTTLETIRKQAQERQARRKQQRCSLLAFANPDFREGLVARADDDMTTRVRSFRSGYYKDSGLRLTILPETEQEAVRVASLFAPPQTYKSPISEVPEGQAVVCVSKAASEEQAKRLLGPSPLVQWRYLLFSTHGLADTRNGMLSCIALSSPSVESQEDGFLQAQEVMDLELDADLVMLSACQTGLGRMRGGEGLVGLSSAFFYAGAESVCASLWQVPTTKTGQLGPTGQLVSEFFKNLKEGKLDRAESLRQAQLKVMRESGHSEDGSINYSDPFCWAAFVLTGEWKLE